MRRTALLALVNLVLLELSSIALIVVIGIVRPERRIDLRVERHFAKIDAAYWRRAANRRDPLLGWDSHAGDQRTHVNSIGEPWTATYDANGARGGSGHGRDVSIATYGNSFVHCDEVNDDQTWQHFLQELLEADVRNYGVGGYGVGQTWLKLERNLDRGRIATFTVFGIYEDGLDRAVNNFRPFIHWRTAGQLGFKPSYRYRGGEVVLLPNPWSDSSWTLDELELLALRSAKSDYWVSNEHLLVPEFPYVLQSLEAIRYVLHRASRKLTGGERRTSLWETGEGQKVMRHIVDEFVSATRAVESVPVVLLIPSVRRWSEGRRLPKYHEFKTKVLKREFEDLLVLDVYEAEFDELEFSIQPFRGHASPYGNRVIAEYIASRWGEMRPAD